MDGWMRFLMRRHFHLSKGEIEGSSFSLLLPLAGECEQEEEEGVKLVRHFMMIITIIAYDDGDNKQDTYTHLHSGGTL